jgi:hypothetical protein
VKSASTFIGSRSGSCRLLIALKERISIAENDPKASPDPQAYAIYGADIAMTDFARIFPTAL